jgi:hypothetical protein
MSWMNDEKTGRPKEEGGHKRVNISLDLNTRKVLNRVENRSKLIEYCISVFVQPKWKHFIEPKETICNGSKEFVEGASFEFVPHFNPGSAILGLNCYFDRLLDDDGVAFRVSVNGKEGVTLVEQPAGFGYSCSQVYSEDELGFFNMEKTFHDQKCYVFKFEYKALSSSGWVKVKDIHFSIFVIENPLLNEIADISNVLSYFRSTAR